ncbi:MAG: hypothetical protein KatS3mg033_0718 [Thermonema sp.]|uniref:hypothetical protein n=1 Tax=Thermonema sp. TaxID=2231181 RepID=UPI0021DF0BCF|nr:hypothetical protein [Thermonema sp.]GIV38918.1 MAG: hypothetical protein KatS3mg033_0718 [Thermonema sp.]
MGALFVAGCLLSCDPMLFDTFERVTKIVTLEPRQQADSIELRGQFVDVSPRDEGRSYGFYYVIKDATGSIVFEDTTIVDSVRLGEVGGGFEFRHSVSLPSGGRIEYAAAVDQANYLLIAEVQAYEVQPDKTPALYIQSVSNITHNDARIIGIVERPPVDGLDVTAVGLEIKAPDGSVASFEDPGTISTYPLILEDEYSTLQANYGMPALVPDTEYTLVLLARLSDNSLRRSAEVRFRTLPAPPAP